MDTSSDRLSLSRCRETDRDLRLDTWGHLLMNPPSVLIIAYHFYPSTEIGARRPTALARFLVDQGLRVSVVSAFGGQSTELGSEILPGVFAVPVPKPSRTFTDAVVVLKRRIYRPKPPGDLQDGSKSASPSVAVQSPSFLTRIRSVYFRMSHFIDEYKSWGRHAYSAAVREGKRHPPSLVFSSSPPPTVLWVATLAARRLRVPHIADLRDPWTDAISEFHTERRIELAMARKIERWVMRSAAAITSTGARVADLLIERQPELAPKTFVVRNGYDGAVRVLPFDTGGRLAILFAGELYLNRDPFPLLYGLERLLSRPEVDASRVRVTFMGRKTEYAGKSFLGWLEGKRCAEVVKFVASQPASVVDEATLASTVVLNLAQLQPLSIPAKTFEHLASGRENLLLCEDDSESAQLVAKIPGVLQVDPRNSEALDRLLLDLYERHVIQGRLRAPAPQDVAVFSRATANDAFWRVMRSTAPVVQVEVSKESMC
jgi:Glycosyl transferase 4-like domain